MFGGLNPQKIMQQVQKVQDDMAALQEELDAERLENTSGGGMVKVTTSGMGELVAIEISPDIVDPQDIETLQDLITVGVREAVAKAQAYHQERMGQITAQMPKIPGMGF